MLKQDGMNKQKTRPVTKSSISLQYPRPSQLLTSHGINPFCDDRSITAWISLIGLSTCVTIVVSTPTTTMTNPHMMGVVYAGRADHFNLKGSLCVIGIFGVITIISYFNELSKAGLLRRGIVPNPLHFTEHQRSERSVGEHDAIIQNSGHLHQFGLEIIRDKKNSKHGYVKNGDEVNINRLYLRQDAWYEQTSSNVIPFYNPKNILSNFYTTMNMSLYDTSALDNNSTSKMPLKRTSNASLGVIQKLNERHNKYRTAVMVFVHQHEPHTHLLCDCLKNISHEERLIINNTPINKNSRKQWYSLTNSKRNSFDVLHGGISFGVCEGIGRPCSYIALVAHPVDRLVGLYELCKNASMKGLCQLNNIGDAKRLTLKQFIIAQGSSLFEKLLFYARHCRLIGEDKLCLQGSMTSILLSQEENHDHLKHILQHIESWFVTIGLVERFNESLALLQSIYGYQFSECLRQSNLLYSAAGIKKKPPAWLSFVQKSGNGWVQPGVLHAKMRKFFLRDKDVIQALHADLVIYNKMVQIFKKQLNNKHLVLEYQNSYSRQMKSNSKKARPTKVKGARILQGKQPGNQKDTDEGLQKNEPKAHQVRASKGHSQQKHPHLSKLITLKRNKKLKDHTGIAKQLKKSKKDKQHVEGVKEKLGKVTRRVRGEAILLHPKMKVKFSNMTTKSSVPKVTNLFNNRIPKKPMRRNVATKRPPLKSKEGLDEILVQNLSALELSKFHAEGVRPGMLEKSSDFHLRYLPHIAHRRLKRKKKQTNKFLE